MEQSQAQPQSRVDSSASQRQNIEQQRAKQAWSNVTSIKDLKDKELEKKYRSLARGLNAMVQINGLGQTLGFLYAKWRTKQKEKEQAESKKTEHYYLLEHLSQWMRTHFKASNSGVMGTNFNGLLNWVTHQDTTSADYRRATTECLAFGIWLRRFAEAELEEGDS
jgi:CRISPR-associated protein Cmr5